VELLGAEPRYAGKSKHYRNWAWWATQHYHKISFRNKPRRFKDPVNGPAARERQKVQSIKRHARLHHCGQLPAEIAA